MGSFLEHKSKKHEDSFLGSFGYGHTCLCRPSIWPQQLLFWLQETPAKARIQKMQSRLERSQQSWIQRSQGGKMRLVTNKVPVQDTKTICEAGYEKRCENQWVCLDYPKQDNLDYCQNKKWQPTNEGCKSIHVDKCRDEPFTRYEDRTEKKCRTIHKQVPTQITGKVAFRECPGKASYEYTPTEVREMDFTGY